VDVAVRKVDFVQYLAMRSNEGRSGRHGQHGILNT
jgi:hypothetical protein